MTTRSDPCAHDRFVAESASARAGRALELCGSVLDELVSACDGDRAPGASLGALRARVGASLLLERLLSGPLPDEVDCASLLERIATAHLMASTGLSMLSTSIVPLRLPRLQARRLVVLASELMLVGERVAGDGERVGMKLRVERDGVHLVVALGVFGASGLVALDAVALAAFARAGRLARRSGGVVSRGVDGDAALICGSVRIGESPRRHPGRGR